MATLPDAERITELCRSALRAHDEGDAHTARAKLAAARAALGALDAEAFQVARELVDEVHGKLRRPKGLQQLN